MSNLGTITYQVEVETAALVTGTDKADKQLDKLNGALKKTDGAAKDAGKAIGSTGAALSTTGTTAVDATKKIDGAGNALDGMEEAAVDAGKAVTKVGTDLKVTSTSIDKAASSSSKFSFVLTPLAASIAGLVSVQALTNLQKLSEQFTLLESRVKRLSASAADAKTNYASLVQISSAGGSDLTTTIKLWESLTASLVSLGATRDQILSLTDTLQKIGKIGGSSAEEISSALRQFSQAVAGGTLRAEEFNSIIEQMPELGRKIAEGLGIPFGELRQQMLDGKLTIDRVLVAIQAQTGKVNDEFKKVPRSVGDASNAIVNAMGVAISKIDQATGASNGLARALDAVAKGIKLSTGDLDQQQKLAVAMQKRVDLQTKLADPLTGSATRKAAEKELVNLNDQIKAIQDRKVAEQKAENDKLSIKTPENKEKTDSQKALAALEKEAELTRLVGVERAKAAAADKLGANAKPEEIAVAQKLAAEIYNLENARKSEASTNKKLTTEAEQLAKKRSAEELRGNEQNLKTIDALQEAIYQTSLSTEELAARKAELSLNEYASQEDIDSARALGVELEKLNVIQAKRKEFGAPDEAAKKITGTVDPLSGGAFDDQTARYQAEADAEMQRYADQLVRLNEAKVAQVEVLGGYQTLEEQMAQTHADRLAQIESAKNQSLLSSGEKLFDGLAGATAAFAGEQSGAYAAMFAVSKAFAVAQAGLQLSAALTQVLGDPTALTPAQKFANVAAVAAAGGTLVSAVAGATYSGKALGGPVQAEGMYRVNETGAPEIFNAANGRQYMMPNSRGEVVSNKDASQSGGEPNVVVNIQNNAGGATATATTRKDDRTTIIDVVVSDMMSNGRIAQATNRVTGTRRSGG